MALHEVDELGGASGIATMQPSCLICQSVRTRQFCSVFVRPPERAGTWKIIQCQDCGFGWTSPRLSSEEVAEFYPASYLGNLDARLDEFFSRSLMRTRSWREETAKVRLLERFISGGRILDVGCGDGKFLWALDPKNWRRSGLDFSSVSVGVLRSRMPEIEWVFGDFDSSRLEKAAFDVLTFWHSLEHLSEPVRALQSTRTLLKQGGLLLLSLPMIDSLQARLFRRYWYAGDVPRHLYHFSQRSVSLLLEQSGFELRRKFFFSRSFNFHHLKHSLLTLSRECFGTSLCYYGLKPLLYLIQGLEAISGNYGVLTAIAQKR
jgi:ubiquinone/menaquinone biosynthesis C-methylase UbiE